MSLEVHILHAHLKKFKDNMSGYSVEPGERFHKDKKNFEQRYHNSFNKNMMGDYVWGSFVQVIYFIHANQRKMLIIHCKNHSQRLYNAFRVICISDFCLPKNCKNHEIGQSRRRKIISIDTKVSLT